MTTTEQDPIETAVDVRVAGGLVIAANILRALGFGVGVPAVILFVAEVATQTFTADRIVIDSSPWLSATAVALFIADRVLRKQVERITGRHL
jgi:ABC-type uncharacterized transport system permease subunit